MAIIIWCYFYFELAICSYIEAVSCKVIVKLRRIFSISCSSGLRVVSDQSKFEVKFFSGWLVVLWV